MRLRILVLCFLLPLGAVLGESIETRSGTLRLPEGWVVLKRDPKNIPECSLTSHANDHTLRNSDGTVWITWAKFRPEAWPELMAARKDWKAVESGKLAGFDYTLKIRPGKESNASLVFPQIRTSFEIGITQNGRSEPNEVLKWWTPPQEEQFQKALAGVKEMLLSGYSPADPDTAKKK